MTELSYYQNMYSFSDTYMQFANLGRLLIAMSETESRPAGKEAEAFAAGFRGAVLRPENAGYDDARSIWNAMIDRRPAIVARCAGAADVISAVNFAREHDLLLAVKGGGHNVAGNAVCDDGLMLDLSPMNAIRVDPNSKTARVGPGVRMADIDHETAPFGLVVPGGVVSTTGLSGLTLGGGFGWLCRKYGLALDNLRSVDIVTADGRLRHASGTENPDLFWGVRGGGGNFGVVTSFEFDLHEMESEVLAGLVVYPVEDAREVLRHWRSVLDESLDDLSVWANCFTAPEEDYIPEAYHGEKVVAAIPFYAGEAETEKSRKGPVGTSVVSRLREFGDPIADTVESRPFIEWQRAFDGGYPEGDRYYWKSHNFTAPDDGTFDVIAAYARSAPTPETRISITHLGGAVNRVPPDATAYPHRDADFLVNITTRWADPERDEECISWTRAFFDALAEFATGGTYVNLISEREGEESMAYRENYDRLVALKNEYDPNNVFRMNQNVEPTV